MIRVLTQVTAPTVEPVTVEELKADRRVVVDDEDTLIASYLLSARRVIERVSGLALLEQTWELALDAFPCAHHENPRAAILLPKPPLRSVVSIKYTDADGTLQTLASSEYTVDTRAFPGSVCPAYGKAWPGIRSVPNAIVVQFTAGYGTTAEEVPETLRDAVRLEAGDRYEHREDQADDTIVSRGAITRLLAEEKAYVV
jgi:uncharacterized phiE125 gp8 family phage protein